MIVSDLEKAIASPRFASLFFNLRSDLCPAEEQTVCAMAVAIKPRRLGASIIASILGIHITWFNRNLYQTNWCINNCIHVTWFNMNLYLYFDILYLISDFRGGVKILKLQNWKL